MGRSCRTLTLVPIDLRLADIDSLSKTKRRWLYAYHAEVATAMDGLLDAESAE